MYPHSCKRSQIKMSDAGTNAHIVLLHHMTRTVFGRGFENQSTRTLELRSIIYPQRKIGGTIRIYCFQYLQQYHTQSTMRETTTSRRKPIIQYRSKRLSRTGMSIQTRITLKRSSCRCTEAENQRTASLGSKKPCKHHATSGKSRLRATLFADYFFSVWEMGYL